MNRTRTRTPRGRLAVLAAFTLRGVGPSSAEVATVVQVPLSGVPVAQRKRGEELVAVVLRAVPEDPVPWQRNRDAVLTVRSDRVPRARAVVPADGATPSVPAIAQ